MSEKLVQSKPLSPSRAYKNLASQAPAALRSLIADLGYSIDAKPEGGYRVAVETLTTIAVELSQLAGKAEPWGWRYLHGVLNDKEDASAKLTQAIFAWGAVVDGAPAIFANTQDVMVRARAGQLHPGSVVLAASKRCVNATCRVAFVPVVPLQKYCSQACRISAAAAAARRAV
jgi:hypothetical protein